MRSRSICSITRSLICRSSSPTNLLRSAEFFPRRLPANYSFPCESPSDAMIRSMKHILSFGLLAALGMAQTPPPSSMPGLKLGLDELKAQYAHVGVGRRLRPKKWPNGARVAVALSFDVDNATVPLSRGDLGSEVLSRGQYGAIDGLPRILRVLDKENVPASFFIPAVSAALNPEMISVIQSKKR